ncbi:MAG: hypothetical protein AB7S75_03190 [Desulfococcaceae bacterium]
MQQQHRETENPRADRSRCKSNGKKTPESFLFQAIPQQESAVFIQKSINIFFEGKGSEKYPINQLQAGQEKIGVEFGLFHGAVSFHLSFV